MKKVVVGIFLGVEKPVRGAPKQDSKLLDTITVEEPVNVFLARRDWKANLIEKCKGYGYEVRSVNVLRGNQRGCDIAVTVVQSQERLRGKPVTIGGRPVGPPTTGKTMAAVRRNQGRK